MRSFRARVLPLALFAATAATAAVTSGVGPDGGGSAQASHKRPNVLVVMSDDQTTESMRVMPQINKRIGEQGETFKNFFVSFPLCCPSRATYLTGDYGHNTGVLGNSPPEGGFAAFDTSNDLPVWLQNDGYFTGHVGKFLNGYGGNTTKTLVPPGWSEWHANVNPVQSVYDYDINDNGTLTHFGTAPTDFKGDVITERAVNFINGRAPSSTPFFLSVAYTAPHSGGPSDDNDGGVPDTDCNNTAKPAPRHAHAFDSEPLPRPPSFDEADVSDKPKQIRNQAPLTANDIANITHRYRCRLASLLHVDEGVDRLIDALKDAGELDNTFVIYTSDNGFFHGEHRIKNGKNKLYEEANRDPLLIRGPGIPEDKNVNDIVVNADLAPTILDTTGAQAGLPEDGRSLLTYADKPSAKRGRALLFEVGYGKGVRTARYAYIERNTGEKELYDLENDPFELQNRAGDPAYAAAQSALATDLAGLRTCAGQSCRTRPDLDLKLREHSVHRNGHSCAPGKVGAQVKGDDGGLVDTVEFSVDGHHVGDDGSKPFKDGLPRKRLKKHKKADVRATAHLLDGRLLTLDDTVRACR
jgi:N-acetylglucosamine-6-sulfatase